MRVVGISFSVIFKINTDRMRLLNRELNTRRRKLLEACRIANTLLVNTSQRLEFLASSEHIL